MENNPEELHAKASELNKTSNKTMQTESGWVNPGTPVGALANESDLPNPEASVSGSQSLRDNLVK